jgi:putative transposase
MPRWARPHRPRSLHHLIARFVDREHRLTGEEERAEYLRRLGAAFGRSDWTLLGYALMSSHVHLCALAGEEPSAPLMRGLHGGFAGWLNRRQGRLGPSFADRYQTVVCPAERALELLAYLHNNPVRAGVVRDPAASPWTSHGAYLERRGPPWLARERGLALCGLDGTAAGRRAFHWRGPAGRAIRC